jgi:hypothetical protein
MLNKLTVIRFLFDISDYQEYNLPKRENCVGFASYFLTSYLSRVPFVVGNNMQRLVRETKRQDGLTLHGGIKAWEKSPATHLGFFSIKNIRGVGNHEEQKQ